MHNVTRILHKRLHKMAVFSADFFIVKEFIL